MTLTFAFDGPAAADCPSRPSQGSASPWGPIRTVTPAGPFALTVAAAFGDGLWLSAAGRAALPPAIVSPHGPEWWDDQAGAALIATYFYAPVASGDLHESLITLLCLRPDWLDAIAAPHGKPNAAQARTILLLWERFSVREPPNFALFPRKRDTGMVHGWIGDRLFVGIEPCGRAHS